MKYLISYMVLSLLCIPACSENPFMPGSVAKNFVHSYFVKENRDNLLDQVTGIARVKLSTEKEYSRHLNIPDMEVEIPSGFQLIDSIKIDLNHEQYTFAILYPWNISPNETMQVVVEKSSNEWKVSNYRFIRTGEP